MYANRLIFPATRWLTFDCYGTLINWRLGIRRQFEKAFNRSIGANEFEECFSAWHEIQFKLLSPYRPYREVLSESFSRFMRERRIRITPAQARAFAASVRLWEPFPDVRDGLHRLKDRYLVAIVSNIDNDLLSASVKRMGVFFNATVTAEDVEEYKPSDRPLRKLLEVVGSPPEEILHCAFGVEYDLGPARKLGFKTALIRRGPVPLKGLVPDHEFANLNEMADLFLKQHRP